MVFPSYLIFINNIIGEIFSRLLELLKSGDQDFMFVPIKANSKK